MVKLRNPWSRFEWKGDWSDNSKKWTPEIVKQVGFEKNDKDGVFWMSFKDYAKHFTHVNVCKYVDEFQFNSFKLYDAPEAACHIVKVRFKESGDQTLSVSQIDKMCFPRQMIEDKLYGRTIMMLVEEDQSAQMNWEYVGSAVGSEHERDTYLEFTNDCTKAYLLYIEMEWHDQVLPQIKESFNVTCYGQGFSNFSKYTDKISQ